MIIRYTWDEHPKISDMEIIKYDAKFVYVYVRDEE